MNFRQRFCNALVVKHKYSDSLPINQTFNYKRESTRNPRYDQSHTNTLRNHYPFFSCQESFSLTNLTVEGGLADATSACYSSTQFILQVLHLQGRPYSQQHPFAMTRSLIVDFLHQQDPFKKNPPMKNLHFPTKFGHARGYSSMSFLVRKMKICQRCRIIFYL